MGKKRFREALLEGKVFVYTLELVPGRGSRGKTQDEILKLAEEVARTKLVHALSVTDNPGGHPALSPDVIGQPFHINFDVSLLKRRGMSQSVTI
jgi:methylenetetrahydrofolate reductase (NADPH)